MSWNDVVLSNEATYRRERSRELFQAANATRRSNRARALPRAWRRHRTAA